MRVAERTEVAAWGLAEHALGVYQQLVDHYRDRGLASGIHLLPLHPDPEGVSSSGGLLYLRDGDVEAVRPALPQAVAQLQRDLGVPDLFSQPGSVLNLERTVGRRRWLRSDVYQEHFRPIAAARQLVLGIRGAGNAPRAFVALCRAEHEAQIDREDELKIIELRGLAERALCAFDIAEDWSRPIDEILASLATALPIPAILMDGAGNISWMNAEAEVRLGLVSYTFGSSRLYGGASACLAELVHWVRQELALPGASLEGVMLVRPSWLAEGERLVVKRVAAGGATTPASVLVCLHVPPVAPPTLATTTTTRRLGLSGREVEVALLAAQGFTVLNIAANLDIAESTAKTYLKRIYTKLGVCSRVELTRLVLGS